MQNTKTKRIFVIALVVISLFILATQSYATGVGDVGGATGSMSGSGSDVYEVIQDGAVGDSPAARDSTLGDESEMASENDTTTGDTMNEDGGTSWMSVIVAIVIAVALIAVVLALIPKKRMD